MTTSTPLQGISLPQDSDNPVIPTHLMVLASALEKRGVMRFADATARDAAITAPENGMFVWLTTPKTLTYYDGAWKTFNKYTQSLVVAADDGVNEGGEITYTGAGSYKSWGQDSYQNTMRFKYDVGGTPATVMTLSATRLTLGTDVLVSVGGADQPVIRSGTGAPNDAVGVDGDLYVRYT
jgi:hypothetical protein